LSINQSRRRSRTEEKKGEEGGRVPRLEFCRPIESLENKGGGERRREEGKNYIMRVKRKLSLSLIDGKKKKEADTAMEPSTICVSAGEEKRVKEKGGRGGASPVLCCGFEKRETRAVDSPLGRKKKKKDKSRLGRGVERAGTDCW